MAGHDDYCLEEYTYLYQPDLLQGKVAFITGGGSGIGFRIAEIFMRHGCDTVIGSRRLDKIEESAKVLRNGTGRECLAVQLDVRKYDAVERAVKLALKKFGKIDILINSAAGNFLAPASSMSSNAFRTVMEIDAVGTFNTSKAVYDHHFKDHGGVIINISATLYHCGVILQAHVGSAKAAIDAMSRHLAVEWGPNGVRVNCVAPGPIEGTEGIRKLGGALLTDESKREAVLSQIPLGRMGTRKDIAESVLFLASPLGSYITGSVLVVDGGEWLTNGAGTDRLKLMSKL